MKSVVTTLLMSAVFVATASLLGRTVAEAQQTTTCPQAPTACTAGFQAQCLGGIWMCLPTDATSSAPATAVSSTPTVVPAASSVPAALPPSSCIEFCPDGYQYRTCTEDGRNINYFADPCLTHSNVKVSASASSATTCGPNPLLCRPGTGPSCIEGQWKCLSVTKPADSTVTLTALTPSSGLLYTKVTVSGSGFARRGNVVQFGDSYIPNVRSIDGNQLSFRVPKYTLRPCYFNILKKCGVPIVRHHRGKYNVSVRVNGNVSNTLKFEVTR